MIEITTIIQMTFHCLLAYVCFWISGKLGLQNYNVPLLYFMTITGLLYHKYFTFYHKCLKNPETVAKNLVDYFNIKSKENE